MSYTAPVKDLMFNLRHLAGLDAIAAQLPAFEDAGLETAQAVLDECARLNEGVLAPLNRSGDLDPARLEAGQVHSTPGFQEAWRQFAAGGWQGLQHPARFGGQELPRCLGAAAAEIFNGANLSFALCPVLTDGAIEALLTAGSDAQQHTYVAPMVAGRWTGTMNLTEPQAGSDLALVRTRAEAQPDGSYRLFGTKIFITWGEHDLAENIVHLVLARIAGAPEGVKGISLFIVPKFLPDASGAPGQRNDVRCVGIEHKLGIKASPTAVLQFGDQGGAVGHLVGEPHHGLEYMFVMMNAARFAVGLQGVGVAERAYQLAVQYARERVQGRPVGGSAAGAVPIVRHPDVQRMLMTMRALTQGCRALASVAAAAGDLAHHHPDPDTRRQQRSFHEWLVPLVKGYSTEMCQEVASLGVQVHGGMGFIEETGAAQLLRDARILTIYEGTTAIQANDLVGRKIVRDGGAMALALAREIAATEEGLRAGSTQARAVAARLQAARQAFTEAVEFVVAHARAEPNAVYAGAVPLLMLAGNLMAGWQLARALQVAERELAAGRDPAFMQAKLATARFYADHLLPRCGALRDTVVDGAQGLAAMPLEAF